MVRLFLGLFLLFPYFLWGYTQNQQYHIIVATNQKLIGDTYAGKAIANALNKRLCPSHSISQEMINLAHIADLNQVILNTLSKNPKIQIILIGVGEQAINSIAKIERHDQVFILHSSHQYTPKHPLLKNHAHLIALPIHAVTKTQFNELNRCLLNVIKTVGVAHPMTVELTTQAYQNQKENFPHEQYIAVILGGDAPTPEGKMLYYTPQEAKKLAQYLYPIVIQKGAHLLILNDPRTGKHDQTTGKELPQSHRNGCHDFVTDSFVETLESLGLTEKDFTLFDFQFSQNNIYPAILGLLLEKNGTLYVAGESISMISEASDILPAESVIIYKHDAMNEIHDNCVQQLWKTSKAHILEKGLDQTYLLQPIGYQRTQNQKESFPSLSAAETIANSVIEHLQSGKNKTNS